MQVPGVQLSAFRPCLIIHLFVSGEKAVGITGFRGSGYRALTYLVVNMCSQRQALEEEY
jgi:hypothetical protein